MRCALTVSGSPARSVIDRLRRRFDVVATREGDRTVLIADAVDQAAVRAVMTMLWDTGHEVLAMVTSHEPR